MSSPMGLLSSRGWRLRHGMWMLWGILSFGLLWCVGFAIIGFRAKNRTWLILSGVSLALLVGYIVYSSLGEVPAEGETDTSADTLVGFGLLISWIGGTVLAFVVNRKWLLWLAHNSRPGPWYAQDQGDSSLPARSSPTEAVDNALGRIDAGAASPAAAGPESEPSVAFSHVNPARETVLVDLNTAGRDILVSLPGVDLPWADHIIDVRQRTGSFSSPLDLVTRVGMQPHVFAGIRDHVFASESRTAKHDSSADGRRLEF